MVKQAQELYSMVSQMSGEERLLMVGVIFLLTSKKKTANEVFNSIVDPALKDGTFSSDTLREALRMAEEVEPWEKESGYSEYCSA